MKLTIFFVVFILGITPVASGIHLNQILYDPAGPDYGFEFIEIYNPSDNFERVSDYSIYKANSDYDGWILVWNGSDDYIAPKGYYSIGENNSFDYLVDLKLQNVRGGVRLLGPNIDDKMHWGDFPNEGVLAIIPDGHSFFRNKTNLTWFSAPNKLNTNEDLISISILNSPPKIIDYSVFVIGGVASLELDAEDDNGIDDIQKMDIRCNDVLSTQDFNSTIYFECDSETVEVRLFDLKDYSDWLEISLDSTLFEIFSINGCNALPGMICNISLEVYANVDIEVVAGIGSLYGPSGEMILNIEQTENIAKGEIKKIREFISYLEKSTPKVLEENRKSLISEIKIQISILKIIHPLTART